MRFKKGSKVEVFIKDDTPCGSWRCGELVKGNGRYYDVKYSWDLDVAGAPIVERVSRKVIRPFPPLVYSVRDWLPGDLIEVFEGMSWKAAIVSKLTAGSYYLVKLIGSSEELRAHKSVVRVRQIWEDEKWIMVGKGFGAYEDGKSDLRCYQKSGCKGAGNGGKRKLCEEDDCCSAVNNTGFQESRMVSSRTLKKRSPNGLSYLEAYTRAGQKMEAIGEDSRRQRVTAACPSRLPEKVDAVASPQYMLGEKYMHASFYSQMFEMDRERAEPNGDNGCYSGRSLELSDGESSASSVGSCSINRKSAYRLPHCPTTNSSYESDSHSSDAESFCGWKYEKKSPLPSKEDVTLDIHKLELYAYQCTIGALYCSGPLSWEQEELVTNLRITLHITNDEHLTLLRSLVSGETNHATR